MARIHEGVIRQCKKLASNSADQEVVVATGKIRPSDAAPEQDIASKDHGLASWKPLDIHHMPG